MKTLVWSSSFGRALKRRIQRQPGLRDKVEQTLRQLAEDPFHPSLHSHKLKGQLSGAWACSVGYDVRILFEFVRNPESGEMELVKGGGPSESDGEKEDGAPLVGDFALSCFCRADFGDGRGRRVKGRGCD